MTAPVLKPDHDAIERAAACLADGGLVAMPTETVYGLAGDATNPQAVARIYRVKERPVFNPLIAHLASIEAAFEQGDFSDKAQALAHRFWPGPLTLVVNATDQTTVCDLARAGLGTLAVRVPAHPVANALLQTVGRPLVAPSANPSGRISPTSAAHVAADLGDKIDFILDGGDCSEGLESTVIDARADTPVLLRSGTLGPDDIASVWPGLTRGGEAGAPISPGQLLRHYAPDARLRLNADAPESGEAYLGFGPGEATLNLSSSGNLAEAAANLFSMLRRLDQSHDRIAVAPIPETGLGLAINDRLERAANRD
ncbi:L-threonylcarbamoyladenylate synthase [Henriciella sp. AS95]|uniref:L-threonylcarbamoyladenylate synthase n=1 Tax=Henriciella sp. AS95 TaxID=3135782 RepID=UPI00317820A9